MKSDEGKKIIFSRRRARKNEQDDIARKMEKLKNIFNIRGWL
jgi:hypothetical protein